MASEEIMGESVIPTKESATIARGDADGIIDEGEEKILLDFAKGLLCFQINKAERQAH